MKATIVKMGDTSGICIPQDMLEQCGLSGNVDVEIHNGELIIRPRSHHPRANWDKAFHAIAVHGDDRLIMDADNSGTQWDKDEWQW